MEKIDITIIGAGVVGLAIARELAGGNRTVAVMEKKSRHGQETSSRNSEVIHAGIYYKPNTLKARLCVEGKKLLYEYCKENNVPFKQTGKLIVAFNDTEIEKLKFLYERGIQNGVSDLKFLSSDAISELEPLIKAKKALMSPSTGILSADLFMDSILKKAEEKGAMLITEAEVTHIKKTDDGYEIAAKNQEPFLSDIVINCAGHNADKIASGIGIDIEKHKYKQKFVKGEYFRITKKYDIKRLIYPVPTLMSLGTHLTLDLNENLRAGPSAFEVSEIEYSVDENHKHEFLNAVKVFLPNVEENELIADTSGIRARLVYGDTDTTDFIISDEKEKGLDKFINLVGIESPGLTSSLAIAKYVKELLGDKL